MKNYRSRVVSDNCASIDRPKTREEELLRLRERMPSESCFGGDDGDGDILSSSCWELLEHAAPLPWDDSSNAPLRPCTAVSHPSDNAKPAGVER